MAVALSGAIIIKQEGTRIIYKKKCEKCGTVQSGSNTTSVSKSSSSTLTSSFRCIKCGNNQRIAIQGGT